MGPYCRTAGSLLSNSYGWYMMTITWNETRSRLKVDKARLITHYEKSAVGKPFFVSLQSSYLCLFFHRLSHYFFSKGNKILARAFWHLNLLMTGADISPLSDIGGGFVVHHPLCLILVGKIGENCTVEGHCGIGGGRDTKDIGAGPGLPVLGDDVYMAMGSFVLGSVSVGHGSYIGPKCYITKDIKENSEVQVSEPRKRKVKPSASKDKQDVSHV